MNCTVGSGCVRILLHLFRGLRTATSTAVSINAANEFVYVGHDV